MKVKLRHVLILVFAFLVWLFSNKVVFGWNYWQLENEANIFCMERHAALYSYDGNHTSNGVTKLTPMEAFVLSHYSENVPPYFSPVQQAFWMTPLGHKINNVTAGANELSILALSYEQWVLDVLGDSTVAPKDISFWESNDYLREYTRDGVTVYAPNIDINPTLNRDREETPIVQEIAGEDIELFFGPYSLDYVGASITVDEGYIEDSQIPSDIEEEMRDLKSKLEALLEDIDKANKNNAVQFLNFVHELYQLDETIQEKYFTVNFDSYYEGETETGNVRNQFSTSQIDEKCEAIKDKYKDKYPEYDNFDVTAEVEYSARRDGYGNIISWDYEITYDGRFTGVKVPISDDVTRYRQEYVHKDTGRTWENWDSVDVINIKREYKISSQEEWNYSGAASRCYEILAETIKHIIKADERFSFNDDKKDPDDLIDGSESMLSNNTHKFMDIIGANLISDEKDLGDIGDQWNFVDKNGNPLEGNGYPQPNEDFYIRIKKQGNNVENQFYTLKFTYQYLLAGGTAEEWASQDYQDITQVLSAIRWYETKEIEYFFYGTSLRIEKKLENLADLTEEEQERFYKTTFTFKLTWQYIDGDGNISDEQSEIIKLAGGEKSNLIHFYLKSKEDKITYTIEEINIPEGFETVTKPITQTITAIREGSE